MTNWHTKTSDWARLVLLGASILCCLGMAHVATGQMPKVQAVFPKADSEIAITQWQFLGPFRFEAKDISVPGAERLPVGLNHDYLAEFSETEESIEPTKFALLRTAKPGFVLAEDFRNEPVSTTPISNVLDLATANRPVDYAIAYVAVVIESPKDQNVVISGGVDDSMKVWLNHELLFADQNTRSHFIKRFGQLGGAKLTKGSNFLLVKTCNLTGDWRLIVTLYPHERALEFAQDNAINPILSGSVVLSGQPLRLRGDLLPDAAQFQMEITDFRHAIVDSAQLVSARRMSWSLAKLERDQLYYCRMTAVGRVIERPFYYGELEAGFQKLSQQADPFMKANELVRMDLQAQLGRLQHLLKTESRSTESWDQKVAASFAEVEDNLAALKKSIDNFRQAPGTHLRGYRSSVDGQVLNYWIHVPSRALDTGKAIPLVIVLPWTALTSLPFLESFQMAAFDQTESFRVLGDEFGFAVLQVWGRGNNLGGTSIWNTDVLESLEAVKRDYPIDPDRIYLTGDCEGGRQALLLAERHPERFAAIAIEGPITIERTETPYQRLWMQYVSPVDELQALANIPIFISHDANGNPPYHHSEVFAARGRQLGVDVTLVQTQGGQHGFLQNPMAVKRSLFQFFQGKLLTVSRKIETPSILQRFGVGTGPIEDAFGGPVLIVEGTTGTPTQQAIVHDLVQGIRNQWRTAYFVDCPAKKDSEIAEADIQRFNLVVVGDNETNSLIQRMGRRYPLLSTPSRVLLAGQDYEGNHLGYELIFRNPLNPQTYAVMIGMNQWAPVKDWKLHPSRDGICDFFVFDLDGDSPRLTGAGYFDSTFWQRPAPGADHAEPNVAN
jgi:pimeloyl-ACP methyl ester carboxylesterase